MSAPLNKLRDIITYILQMMKWSNCKRSDLPQDTQTVIMQIRLVPTFLAQRILVCSLTKDQWTEILNTVTNECF